MKKYLTPNHIRYALANLPILTFEVTDACNLKCKYCGYGEFYNDYDERKDRTSPSGTPANCWTTWPTSGIPTEMFPPTVTYILASKVANRC